MRTRIPFRIDRNRPRSLVGQMTDGLRDAIVSGFYKPGDTLPTIHEWTRMYEVSIRVPEGALANLVKEGYVVTRPRHGCIVQPQPGKRVWRGHVVMVRPADVHSHMVFSQLLAMEERLSLAGYLVTTVVVRNDENDRVVLAELNEELSRNVSLAVAVGNRKRVLGCLRKSKVPFLHLGFDESAATGCIGHVGMSWDAARDEFAAHCSRAGIRHVAVIGKTCVRHGVVEKLEALGIRVSLVEVAAELGPERVENLERETCRALDRLFDGCGRKWLPDLIYIEDDYQAIGALFSLLSHGVKMPDDVFFATVKNFGNGPALPISITRIEFNPAEAGKAAGEAAVQFLDGKNFSCDAAAGIRYIVGDTFPESKPQKENKQ